MSRSSSAITSPPSQVGLGAPASASRDRRWLVGLILLACTAAMVGLAVVLDVDLIDDSYIFLRYAYNLAEGRGAVFNVGERSEGFSSPLWTLLLGVVGATGLDLEQVAYSLGLVCGAGMIALLLLAVHRETDRGDIRALAVLGLGLASSPAMVFWSASGMDAALFILLVTASLLSILNDRRSGEASASCSVAIHPRRHREVDVGHVPVSTSGHPRGLNPAARRIRTKSVLRGLSVRSAVLLTLATFARPEGVLLAGYAGAFFLYERRSIRVLWGFALAVTAMFVARYAYYGAWLPNTYYAKVTFILWRRWMDGVAYVLPALMDHALLVVVTITVLVVAWRRQTQDKRPMLFLGGWVVLWSGYVLHVGGDNFALFRFLLPVVPALFLLLGWNWSSICSGLTPRVRTACLCGLALALGVSNVVTYANESESYYGDVRLARSWKKVGRWLDRTTPSDTVIAAVTPGALGYFGRRSTVDMLGLTDRTVSLEGRVYAKAAHGHARYHTDYIFQRDPDIILYHSSGRFTEPVYATPYAISLRHGYALYDFVSDPRCTDRYAYETARLEDGTIVEMQRKRSSSATNDKTAALTP